jgi:hypothetical protein
LVAGAVPGLVFRFFGFRGLVAGLLAHAVSPYGVAM